MSAERVLQELEVTLRQFPLLHMETHVLPEFGVSLENCARELHRQRLKISSPTLAALLRDRARSQHLDAERLRFITRTLQLKTKALSEKSDWFAYILEGKSTPDEPIRDAIALAPQRIQKALRHAQRNRRSKIDVHSAMIDRWIFMCVETERADGCVLSPLHLAMQPNTNFIFASRCNLSPLTSGSIAVGLGWTSAANASLSGRHLESLLRVLQQDKNGTVNGLLSPPPYVPRAVFTRAGVNCTDQDYDMEYSKNILGQDPPTLRKLVGVSNQPFCDEPQFGAGPVSYAVTLESDDVAGMLTSLVRVKAIAANSPWLHAFRNTTSNLIDLDNDFILNE